jgi:hypothetical protein
MYNSLVRPDGNFTMRLNSCEEKINQIVGTRNLFMQLIAEVSLRSEWACFGMCKRARVVIIDVCSWNLDLGSSNKEKLEQGKAKLTSNLSPSQWIPRHTRGRWSMDLFFYRARKRRRLKME